MLSSTFLVHAALKLAPILPQKSQEMQVVRTICSSTGNKHGVSYFFHGRKRRKLYRTLLGHRIQGKTSKECG